jgi:signal transduction histidine kinase
MTRTPSRATTRSIQTRVMVLVASGVLTSILVPGWVAWRALDTVTEQALANRQADATLAAHHLEGVLAREWNKLQEVAAAPSPGPTDILRSVYFRAELMERTFVTDREGRVTYQEPTSPSLVGARIPGADVVIASGRPGASALDASTSGAWVHLLVPVRDWQGRVVGTAGGSINPRGAKLGELLREHTPAESSLELIDARGIVIAAHPAATTGALSDHKGYLAGLIASGTPASGACHTCHGVAQRSNAVMAFTPLRAVPWGVCIKTAEANVLATTGRLRRTLLWLGPLLMAFGLLFAYGAAQSVLRPVRVLTVESERIAGGSLDQPIPQVGRDELGRLGRSLENMRTALKSSIEKIEDANATLERRVDDRTKALTEATRQLAEREEARARLLRQVITAQEDERKRLARELHDETCQTISALSMRLGSLTQRSGDSPLPELVEARNLAVRALDELHRLIYDLRPSVLDDLGLWPAIRWYAERQLVPRGVSVRCEFADVDRRLPTLYETALFRVSQEAISNIAKHAEAEQVLIQGNMNGDTLTIEIEDDGKGFEPSASRTPGPGGHGWGLLGITERVDALGGTVEIDSAPGQGVRLVVAVTLPPEAPRG